MTDKQLVFIISQPRSGSSMLQQILSGHSDIHSLPEPWLMLPLVYTFKKDATAATDYNFAYAQKSMNGFLDSIEAQEVLKSGIRDTALNIYRKTLQEHPDKLFLDKTTRYFHITNELIDLFPNAKFIVLVRNPLAVFASMLELTKKNLKRISYKDRYADLFIAPKKIIDFKNRKEKNIFYIKYEKIVSNPTENLIDLYQFLNIELPQTDLGNYQVKSNFANSTAIDPKSVRKHEKPVDSYKDAWKKSIDTGLKKKWAIEYLDKLGKETVELFGYDFDAIKEDLEKHKVKKNLFFFPSKYLTSKYDGLSRVERLTYNLLSKVNSN